MIICKVGYTLAALIVECDEIGSHLMDERPVASGSKHRREVSMHMAVPGQWVDGHESRGIHEWESLLASEVGSSDARLMADGVHPSLHTPAPSPIPRKVQVPYMLFCTS